MGKQPGNQLKEGRRGFRCGSLGRELANITRIRVGHPKPQKKKKDRKKTNKKKHVRARCLNNMVKKAETDISRARERGTCRGDCRTWSYTLTALHTFEGAGAQSRNKRAGCRNKTSGDLLKKKKQKQQL